MPNRIANYTGHDINIFASAELGTPRYDLAPNLDVPARATELRRLMGFVSIAGFNVPVLEMAHTTTDGLPPPQPDVLGIASLDTLRAKYRMDGNIDGYAAPDDISRDRTGDILGAYAVAVPLVEPTSHAAAAVMLQDHDLSQLADPADWRNFGAYPMKFFAPNTPDVIDPAVIEPILTIPREEPVVIERERQLDRRLTDKFHVPVVRTMYGRVRNPQFPERGNVAVVQQEAVRTYVKLGLPVRRMVILGDLVRDEQGHIQGGRSVMVYDPGMLFRDPF